jgi:hypothetical protein
MRPVDDPKKFSDEEMPGVRLAVKAFKTFMDASAVRVDSDSFPEEWLAHIVHMEGVCDCDLERSYDEGSFDSETCKWYSDLGNRQDWFCYWHGMTMEEFQQMLAEKRAEERRKAQEREERERAYRKARLYELAQEFGVNPELLP